MNPLRSVRRAHDRLLAKETQYFKLDTSPLLLVTGIAAIVVGWMIDTSLSKLLLVAGGLASGLAAEKFAQRQLHRILEQQKRTEVKS